MTRKLLPALVLPILLGACANYVPYTPAGDGDAVALAAKTAPNEVTCRDQPVTGSRFTKKICNTNAVWAQLREQARRDTGTMQEDGRIGVPGG